MLNADEVEIKAVIALEAIVFKKVEQNFVTEINQEPVDMEALNSAPVLPLCKTFNSSKGICLSSLSKSKACPPTIPSGPAAVATHCIASIFCCALATVF